MIADYETLSWPKFRDLDRDRTFLILPVSSTEQHGPHLPVGTDDYILQMFVSGLKDQEYRAACTGISEKARSEQYETDETYFR